MHQLAHRRVVVDDQHERLALGDAPAALRRHAARPDAADVVRPRAPRAGATVKVEPSPGSLSTVTSPPIIWQNAG